TKSAGNKSTSTLVMGDFGMGNGLSLNAAYGSNGDKGTWMRAAVAKELNKGAKLYAGATSSKAAGAGATSVTVMGAGMIVKF
ncbi:MAG: hypothetical protein OEW97_08110, partial [Gammaproteobacteria bacterium]|nr:hypothetical protein [Gammaproteobacteria bacterium]